MGVCLLKAGPSNGVETQNNPVNFTDPSGLDVELVYASGKRVLFPPGYLNHVMQYLSTAQPDGSLREINFGGHGRTHVFHDVYEQHTMNYTEYQSIRLDRDGVIRVWNTADSSDRPGFLKVKDLPLEEWGVQTVRFDSCNSAGKHPRCGAIADELRARGEDVNVSYLETPYVPGKNLAQEFSKLFPGITVIGSAGPTWFSDGEYLRSPIQNPRVFRGGVLIHESLDYIDPLLR